jgi:uncharacterized protein YkwD
MQICLIHSKAPAWRWALTTTLMLALQACGGGGGGGGDASPADAPSPSAAAVAPATPAGLSAAEVALAPGAAAPAPASTAVSKSLIQLDASNSCSIPGLREAVLQQVNLARSDGHVCGPQILPPAAALTWNDTLFSAAARHAADMAKRNYLSHVTPEGADFSQRLTSEGYSWRAAGENIAGGQASVNAVMTSWLGSEGHCRNIMNPVFTEVAVACVAQAGSTLGRYWTMELGSR